RIFSFVAGNLFAAFVNCRVQQSYDVKLVCHDPSVRKHVAHKRAIGYGQVDRRDAYILPAWDVIDLPFYPQNVAAFDGFVKPFVVMIDKDSDKFREAFYPIFSVFMLIDSYRSRPWITPFPKI